MILRARFCVERLFTVAAYERPAERSSPWAGATLEWQPARAHERS
jgi:hypothetical protein